jgi:hypothetical protein
MYLLRNQAMSEKRKVGKDRLAVMKKTPDAHQRKTAELFFESLSLRRFRGLRGF